MTEAMVVTTTEMAGEMVVTTMVTITIMIMGIIIIRTVRTSKRLALSAAFC
jgi:hypothetical protein